MSLWFTAHDFEKIKFNIVRKILKMYLFDQFKHLKIQIFAKNFARLINTPSLMKSKKSSSIRNVEKIYVGSNFRQISFSRFSAKQLV